MAIALVAAMDRRRAIGRGNALPWHLPDDLKRFKALTLGHAILMGGNTARSIGRALPGRRNLVLTRGAAAPVEGMQAVASLDEAIALAGDGDLMVIGGGEIYALALPRRASAPGCGGPAGRARSSARYCRPSGSRGRA